MSLFHGGKFKNILYESHDKNRSENKHLHPVMNLFLSLSTFRVPLHCCRWYEWNRSFIFFFFPPIHFQHFSSWCIWCVTRGCYILFIFTFYDLQLSMETRVIMWKNVQTSTSSSTLLGCFVQRERERERWVKWVQILCECVSRWFINFLSRFTYKWRIK